jgi:hypothetical protein
LQVVYCKYLLLKIGVYADRYVTLGKSRDEKELDELHNYQEAMCKKFNIRVKKFGEALAETRNTTAYLWEDLAQEFDSERGWARAVVTVSQLIDRWEKTTIKFPYAHSREAITEIMMEGFSEYYWGHFDPCFLQLEATNRILLWLEEILLKPDVLETDESIITRTFSEGIPPPAPAPENEATDN